jgi:hypothetical protein
VKTNKQTKVVVCHENHLEYSRYNRSRPKVTKSSCDWKIVAEKSWKHMKKLNLTRVGGADLYDILTATKEFCHNIEEIYIDELSSESQLAQDLDIANVLPDWIIPNGVIFNPKDPSKVTLKNVTELSMIPHFDSDFSFKIDWKDIFSQNLTSAVLIFSVPVLILMVKISTKH